MGRKLRIVIIGAGIGGLTAAAALRQRGLEAEIYERAPELGEVGAGVQLGPNAVKVVRALGVHDQFLRFAAEPTDRVSLSWNNGDLRYRETMKGVMEASYGAKYCMAHRADLYRLLSSLVPANAVRVGAHCTGCETMAEGAVAHFADGTAVEADMVIGADGIHSAVRKSLFGISEARFTEQICWRAMVPMDRFVSAVARLPVELDGSEYTGWIGPTGHVIFYPIRSGEILNIFAGRVSDTWAEESWAVPSGLQEMLDAYAGWNECMLEVFSHVESCYKWGIYDRDPLVRWTRGRVTLLGDAAHPMMPTLAQGAAITMEDAYVLARNLDQYRDHPEQALQAYEAERRPRAGRVQLQARNQFANNRKVPAPKPLPVDWIYSYDATVAGPS